MSLEENKAITRRFNDELWNKGNVDIIDELMSADVVSHPGTQTREQFKQGAVEFLGNCPGMTMTLEDMIAEGDRVAFRWMWTMPHTWEYAGIAPTGKTLKWRGTSIYRIADGKIVEDWGLSDTLSFYKQWGYTPDMEQVKANTWD
jgi:predicted ester cyclase